MKRNSKILIGLLSAVASFGVLYAVAGDHFRYRCSEHRDRMQSHHRPADATHWYEHSERPAAGTPTPQR
ncbi:hypothetical protein [Niabella terrae]